MTPDKVPDPFPVQCVLDRGKLQTIAETVSSIEDKVDSMLSFEGPISAIRERIALIEKSTLLSHERIDALRHREEARDSRLNGLAIKVAVLSSGSTGIIFWLAQLLKTSP